MKLHRPMTMLAVSAMLLGGCGISYAPRDLPPKAYVTAGKTITVGLADNIYSLAQQNNISMRDLIVLNNLEAPYELTPGQKIILPAKVQDVAIKNNLPPPDSVQKPDGDFSKIKSESLQVIASPASTPAKNPVAKSASTPAITPAHPTSAPSSGAMIWPVQGVIVSRFGKNDSGATNDGINIGAPKGAPVVASAPGIVAYAGSDMKGFGNLILIRHDGNLVTAYAHLDRMLVTKDSVVASKDMIGTVGKTGDVKSAQLHFEVRENSKPVDPTPLLK